MSGLVWWALRTLARSWLFRPRLQSTRILWRDGKFPIEVTLAD
jgi:hypothetical protein